jgi:hypothetical protein
MDFAEKAAAGDMDQAIDLDTKMSQGSGSSLAIFSAYKEL